MNTIQGKMYDVTFHLVDGTTIKTERYLEDAFDIQFDALNVKDDIYIDGEYRIWNEEQLFVIPRSSVLYVTIESQDKEWENE